MSGERVERRLAAILAADVTGYSHLTEEDEVGTLSRLKTCRRELIDPLLTEHNGRIVKTTGDGLLIEFPSIVEAVAAPSLFRREWVRGTQPRLTAERLRPPGLRSPTSYLRTRPPI